MAVRFLAWHTFCYDYKFPFIRDYITKCKHLPVAAADRREDFMMAEVNFHAFMCVSNYYILIISWKCQISSLRMLIVIIENSRMGGLSWGL